MTTVLHFTQSHADLLAVDPKAAASSLGPCLRAYRETLHTISARTGPGCPRCQKAAAQRARVGAFDRLQGCLNALPAEAKKYLKQVLKADKVVLRFSRGGGTVEASF